MRAAATQREWPVGFGATERAQVSRAACPMRAGFSSYGPLRVHMYARAYVSSSCIRQVEHKMVRLDG